MKKGQLILTRALKEDFKRRGTRVWLSDAFHKKISEKKDGEVPEGVCNSGEISDDVPTEASPDRLKT